MCNLQSTRIIDHSSIDLRTADAAPSSIENMLYITRTNPTTSNGSFLSKYSLRAVASQLTRVLLTQTRAVTHKSSEMKLRCADEVTRMSSKDKNTILVVEDHHDSREFLRVFLEGEGFDVIEAKNGAEAVILARQQCPDLILTDLHMPELDGTAAVKQIRGIDKLREIPIIAMSGDGLRGMEFFINTDEFGSGYIHYLTKPLNLNELREQINMLLPVKPPTPV